MGTQSNFNLHKLRFLIGKVVRRNSTGYMTSGNEPPLSIIQDNHSLNEGFKLSQVVCKF